VRSLRLVVPLLIALLCVDVLLSWGRRVGWERNTVRNSLARHAERPTARVAQLGSSTSADWMQPDWLEKTLGRPPGDVLDAHINGCHQTCTWSEVRRFLKEGRHFELVTFGTNVFQQCEHRHSKRVLQDTLLMPISDVPALFALYRHGSDPLGDMTRYLGMQLSGAYGDTSVFQRRWSYVLFGPTGDGDAWRWARRSEPPPTPVQTCDYAPESIAFKTAATQALFEDLARLADRSVILLLPDATLADPSPEVAERWEKHRALYRDLVAPHPTLTLLDLSAFTETEGAWRPEHFRDGVHTKDEGRVRQRALFARLLKSTGLVPAK
jgi:hypothetical protein